MLFENIYIQDTQCSYGIKGGKTWFSFWNANKRIVKMNLQTITMWIAYLNIQAKDLTCIKLSVWLQCNEWWELMTLF
jgi:hypothetical protein